MTDSLFRTARHIPVVEATPTAAVNPVTLPAPDRALPLALRVTAPVTGSDLPVVLLSHGGGESTYLPSKDGYGPLVDFYAAHGFAVVQPTHLSARVGGLGLDPAAPGFPIFWRSRVADLVRILDGLDEIEAQAPAVAGRLDHDRIAVVGHSGGSHTAAMLLGARLTDLEDGDGYLDPRVKAGVLLAPVGGGADVLPSLRERLPELSTDFSGMTTRTLVVFGDDDVSPALTARGADWHADPFHHGPGADALLTLVGAKHFLGGVTGYDARESDDEDPDRLAVTQRMTWAYLRSALVEGDPAWARACEAFQEHGAAQGRVDRK
ncbi:alpha/beta hydrolase family protein [Umezawaea tangerina]|uniref:Alpha/beta hydrolase family protein n=1 Tax=Umezawaea tangerina TaxID=84725 RepID=A0A2T0SC04_9PSEU|nr:alpha/beta fold hydrolase [Umezawaea tangerina]PRY30911.1 alpha/beta hydrolase family protein [Umezawaea tangerina]